MYITKEYNLCVGWSGWTSSFDQLLRLFQAGRIVWFKYVIVELCYRQEEEWKQK